MAESRNGIITGGNWIIDHVKLIDTYPDENALTNIREEKSGNGGAPFNLVKALHKMKTTFPLEGIGMVGDDENGRNVVLDCEEMGVDFSQLKVRPECGTSYTDVMTVAATGKRTFFHYRGASAYLSAADFDFSRTRAKIFHLGYLLLLDELDRLDDEGRTGASRVLEAASEAGLITTADIVSEQSDRYRSIVPAALPFVDILFLNELEAKGVTGIEILNKEGLIKMDQAKKAAEMILDLGVRQWVIFHFSIGTIAFSKGGDVYSQPCVTFPPEMIRGTVGAGDAFAAGVLAGVHEGKSMEESLKSGVCVAAVSLLSSAASDGILPWDQCMGFGEKWGFSPRIFV